MSRNKEFICPVCSQIVHYRSGQIRSTHFAHKNADCYYSFYENETKEHALGKAILFKSLQGKEQVVNLNLEYWIPETKQRPDIYFESRKGKKYVIEFQCTPITVEELERRNKLYRSIGIHCTWIFGTEKYSELIKHDKYYWSYKRKACQIAKRIFHILDVYNDKLYKIFHAIHNNHEIRSVGMEDFYVQFLYEKFKSKYLAAKRKEDEIKEEGKMRRREMEIEKMNAKIKLEEEIRQREEERRERIKEQAKRDMETYFENISKHYEESVRWVEFEKNGVHWNLKVKDGKIIDKYYDKIKNPNSWRSLPIR